MYNDVLYISSRKDFTILINYIDQTRHKVIYLFTFKNLLLTSWAILMTRIMLVRWYSCNHSLFYLFLFNNLYLNYSHVSFLKKISNCFARKIDSVARQMFSQRSLATVMTKSLSMGYSSLDFLIWCNLIMSNKRIKTSYL